MRLNRMLYATALCAAALAGCRGASVRPVKDRLPMQMDYDRCLKTAKQLGGGAIIGSMVVKMYVAADGTVPAAFVNSAKGLDFKPLFRCTVDFLVNSKFPGEGLDYLRPLGPVSYVELSLSALLPRTNDVPTDPIDPQLAQQTLEFADWADGADRGWGYFYVQKYKDAEQSFRAFLQGKPDDLRALRGLAATLASSGGDLKEARELAAKAIQLKPDSVATHEAMLRVCIAAKDDQCIFDSFDKARRAPDVNVRSIELATMQDAAKAAAERLQTGEAQRAQEEQARTKAQQEELAKKVDPLGCGKKPEGDERTLCFVKGCFDKGGHTYASSLKDLTGQEYKVGEWKIAGGKEGASKVTLPIRAKGAQPHDANWEVKVGESIDMRPLDIDANNIATQYNACRK